MDDIQNAHTKPTILVVDDTPQNLSLINNLLTGKYKIKVASNGLLALKIARTTPIDLILLDVMMPEMDGYQVCRALKEDARTADIPVIFLTAKTEIEDEEYGLQLGAVDYITKPISPPIVAARIRTHLLLKASSDFLRDKASYLENEIHNRTKEIKEIQDVTILTLASLAETRDNDTGNHIRRTQHYVKALACSLKSDAKFAPHLSDQTIELLFKSAPLHDIGKVGIPDRILLKPGPLTPEEFEIMKTHTVLGKGAIESAERSLGKGVLFLRYAKEIAYSHQEKWDGSGYPDGLSGERIPLSARLMAVSDVYDALISRRVYKPAFSHEEALRTIIAGKGTHFDPDIVEAFIANAETYRAIAHRYKDPD